MVTGVLGEGSMESVLMSPSGKRINALPRGGDGSTMSTPKPRLVVNGSYAPSSRTIARDRLVASVLKRPAEDEATIRKILANHRRRQTRKLGKRNEDPDPYDPSYIFFCLDGRRET